MSNIDKLLVRGIRSFDPHNVNVIEFFTPLTIIVGHNGAGKTTIIECLKYATTGDLPPCSKGGAFVHDPKVAHETDVKAQIKLKFNNVNGRPMVCTRSIQVTQTKTGVRQKTLESLLLVKDPETDEQLSLSARGAELDTAIPMHLGVSKAILDNVIFCHQEESNWPLSEPAVLKKKFDEIFAATRYTKALEAIKALRKDQVVEMKLDRQRLDHLAMDREKAQKIKTALEHTRDRVKGYRERMTELNGELARVDAEMETILEKLYQVQQQKTRLTMKINDQKNIRASLDEIQRDMIMLTDTNEALEAQLVQQREQAKHRAETIQMLEAKRHQLTEQKNRLNEQYEQLVLQRAKLASDLETYTGKLQVREEMVRKLCQDVGIPVSGTLTEEDIQYCMCKIDELTSKKIQALNEAQLLYRNKEAEYLREKREIDSEIACMEAQQQTTRQNIERIHRDMTRCLHEMDSIMGNDAMLRNKERELEQEKQMLEQLRSEYTADCLDVKRRTLDSQLRELDTRIAAIDEQIERLGRDGEVRAALEVKRRDVLAKQTQVNQSLSEILLELGKTMEEVENERATIRMVREHLDVMLAKEKEANDRHAEAARHMAVMDAKLSTTKTTLEQKQQELAEKVRRLKEACGDEDLPTALTTLEQKLSDHIERVAELRSAAELYRIFVARAEEQHHCPLCTRTFAEAAEEERFLQKLRRRQARAPQEIQDAQNMLKAMEQGREALRALLPVWDDVKRLQQHEIPEIEANYKREQREASTVHKQLEKSKVALVSAQSELERARVLHKKSETLEQMLKDIQSLECDVIRMEEELRVSGDVKTIQEYRKERDALSEQLRSIQRERDRIMQDTMEQQQRIQRKENHIRDLQAEIININNDVTNRRRLEDTVREQRAEIKRCQDEIEECERKLALLEPKREEIERRIESNMVERDSHQDSIRTSLEQLQDGSSRIARMTKELEAYPADGGRDLLKTCEIEIAQLKEEIQRVEEQLNATSEEIQKVERQAHELCNVERNINNNLRYRELSAKFEELEREIVAMKAESQSYDQMSYSEKQNKLKEKQSKLNRERASLEGEVKQMEDQIIRMRSELNIDYKDIDSNYQNQMIKVKTTEMAHADLEKYAAALDHAIMRYHSLKMQEINKIIHELWINTYRGNDIDTIEIRSDQETTRGNRSYNYRVVMIKGNTELDMRGRCSAGQKILCSLIIRLALAETFCINCGILALDEPTTNLDRENVESLAESLASIVRARRQQRNFQLIIITHDEEFMQLLGKSELADYYWRISKNSSQHSTIEKHAISST